MEKKIVKRYVLQWNPIKESGVVKLHLDDNTTKNIFAKDASLFNALANVLQQAPVALFKDGTLGTAWEPVIDGDSN